MWSILLALAIAATQAYALLRFPCAQHTVTRSDPLISPGNVSAHVHQVVGGNRQVTRIPPLSFVVLTLQYNSFDFLMPSGMDLQQSTCSTCSVKENKSNYWTPTLYFQSPKNGTFKRVAQKPGSLTGNPNGGMVVYYIQIGQVTAFPQGFRMITGDPYLRAYNSSIDDSRSIMMRCLATDLTSGPDTNGMPTTKCKGGIRSQVNFPTCWDGKNVDTTNHKDHVRYAINASFGNFGQGCPSTHPVQLPLLFLETYWDTTPFDNEWTEGNGKQPFVWAMGDPTGFGYHADYMMGWPAQTLKNAMAQCNDQGGQVSACPVLTTRSEQEMNDCAVPNRVEEDLGGWLTQLPGCNPVYPGPGRAPYPTDCGAPTEAIPKSNVTFLVSNIPGWTPVGCASENSGEKLLTGPSTTNNMMSVESCLNYCNGQGQSYAGIKNNVCSCGNTINTSKFSSSYACDVVCTGNVNQFCGAVNRIAVYSGKGAVDLPPQTTLPPTTTITGGGPTSNPTGPTVPKWGQCGGIGWTGGTVCAAGSTCTYSNA
ncbi:hypothetical protein V5O48_004728, partial [Marasmius crinis-equi]